MRWSPGSWAGTAAVWVASHVLGAPPPVMEAVPADAVAAYSYAGPGHEQPSEAERSAFAWAAFLADRASDVGLMSRVDPSLRCWIDSLAAAPDILSHPHAMALLGFEARARADGGHELAGVRAALVLHTEGANSVLERRIRHLLTVYTNRDETALVTRTLGADRVFSIRDRRLPPWAEITWGRLGDFYVVTMGKGTFDRVARTIKDRARSLAAERWLASAVPMLDGEHRLVTFYAHFDRLRRGVDRGLADKIDHVLAGMGLGGVQRGVWAFGRKGRVIEVTGVLRREQHDEIVPVIGERFLGTLDRTPVPQEATWYAVGDIHPRTLLGSMCEAYLRARSPRAREAVRAFWFELQARADVLIEQDIFGRLRGPVVIHDYPPQALDLPFAWTILLPIDGDARTLRSDLDRLLNLGRQRLEEAQSIARLVRAPDGVWYTQFGIVGPGLAVTDHWLVMSFSAQAVRQNVALLGPTRARGTPHEPPEEEDGAGP